LPPYREQSLNSLAAWVKVEDMHDCLVCRIIRKEEPVGLIYEDADTVVFPFMFPLTEGHVIVAPKQHFADIFEADPESLAKMMAVVRAVSRKMRLALGINAANLINNSGQTAGQDVFHFHMHVIPRRPADQLNLKEWWLSKARAADRKQLDDLRAKLEFGRLEP